MEFDLKKHIEKLNKYLPHGARVQIARRSGASLIYVKFLLLGLRQVSKGRAKSMRVLEEAESYLLENPAGIDIAAFIGMYAAIKKRRDSGADVLADITQRFLGEVELMAA
jgi:hypothetical protein